MPAVNPEILVWARETAGLTRQSAATKIGIRDAYGMDGGPNYYVVRRHRVGQALLGFTSRMLEADALSMTKAARILDIKPVQVDKLLRPASTT